MTLKQLWSHPAPASICLVLAMILAASAAGAVEQELSARDFTGIHFGYKSDYGSAMAASGGWLAVGAPGTSTDLSSTYAGGRVLLWKREADSWTLKQQLIWPDADVGSGNGFGRTLAMDGARLLVSSTGTHGKVHVFELVNDVWTLDATLAPQGSNPGGAGFGDGLALSGDLAVIGSSSALVSGPPPDTGYLDVYKREASGWVPQGRLADPDNGASLGRTIAIHGGRIFAGCPLANDDTTGYQAGKVAVFEKSGDTWAKTTDLLSPSPAAGEKFGNQIIVQSSSIYVCSGGSTVKLYEFSLSGGFSLLHQLSPPTVTPTALTMATDGSTLAVASGTSTALVVIYRRKSDQSWEREHSDFGYNDTFQPRSLLCLGDELLQGGYAPFGYSGKEHYHLLRTVRRTTQPRSPSGYWRTSGIQSPITVPQLDGSKFGYSLARDGDWLTVGAPGLGAIVYKKTPQGDVRFHSLLQLPSLPDALLGTIDIGDFGRQVACSGGRIAVGMAYYYNHRTPIAAYTYDSATDRWLTEGLLQPTPNEGEGFGMTLAMSGDLLAVASVGEYNGWVHLYRRLGSQWILEGLVHAPEASWQRNEKFAQSISLEEERLLVGAPETSAYVFERKNGVWTEVARLAKPTSYVSLYDFDFGRAVSLHGDRALICTSDYQKPAALFEKSAGVWRYKSTLPALNWQISPPGKCVLFGSLALIADQYNHLRIFNLVQGKWVTLDPGIIHPAGLSTEFLLDAETLVLGTLDKKVLLTNLARPPAVTWNGQGTELPSDAGATVLDIGQYRVGGTYAHLLGFKVSHRGTLPVRVTASITGGAAAEFSLGSASLELQPGQSQEFLLKFLPQTTGPKEITLRLTSSAPEDQAVTFIIRALAVSADVPITFTQQPQSALTPPEGIWRTLQVRIAGTYPRSLRWLRNGSVIPGATSDTLFCDKTGAYQVEVTNPAGRFRSAVANVATYVVSEPQVALQNETVRCGVSISGPGVQVSWQVDNGQGAGLQPLSPGGGYSGTTSPTLAISPTRFSHTGGYRAVLRMPTSDGGAVIIPADTSVQIVTPPTATIDLEDCFQMRLNRAWPIQCGINFDGQMGAPVFQVTGLPPGMTATPEGTLQGAPTRAGHYRLRIIVRSGRFVSAPLIHNIIVTEDNLLEPGLYWGALPASPTFPLGGAATVELRPDSSFIGYLQTGTQRSSFTGRLLIENDAYYDPTFSSNVFKLAHRTAKGPYTAWLAQESGAFASLQFHFYSGEFYDEEEDFTVDTLFIRSLAPAAVPAGSLGKHTFGLLGVASEDGRPDGHGFGTLTVTPNRSVTYAGQLSDGTGITGSGCFSDNYKYIGEPAKFHFYAPVTTVKAALHGAVMVPHLPGAASAPTTVAHWTKLLTPGRTYADGFEDIEVGWITSRYNPAQAGQHFSPGAHVLEIKTPFEVPRTTPFTFTPQMTAVFGTSSGANPLTAQLSLYAPTGFFTGQLTLRDHDPANPSRIITRMVPYRGMILPEQGMGVGHFLLPSLPDPTASPPTTLSTSPIYSGAVMIEAEARD